MTEPTAATRQASPRSTGVSRQAPPANSHDQQPGHPLADLHQTLGNLGVLQCLANPAIQPKLEIGAPGRLVAMAPNSPRSGEGPSGLGSQVSCWACPPCR